MALTTGTKLGSYEVVSLVGAGGMGEVYRARDPRLGRDVAIKVLPVGLTGDVDRLHRFEQEARAAAALNHPNILTVHEIGSHTPADGPAVPFVVSELIDGRTLREMLAEAPAGLPTRKAIDFAAQIANGLAAAHEKGIVHRDIKPENLIVTRDGRVKILDFGLAKLREDITNVAADGVTLAPTLAGGTEPGVVLGTAGYMSPEQVRAQRVDHRSDIFSYGAVLYEMLSGQRAFKGATAADTITAILTTEPPDLSSSTTAVTPALDRIVRHCLEKSPELRFQSARDIVFNLESLSAVSATSAFGAAAPPPRPIMGRRLALATLVVVAAAAAAAGAWRIAAGRHSAPVFRQITFRHGELDNARFSPDGRTIIYTAAWEAARPEIFAVPADDTGGRSLGFPDARLLAVSKTGELAMILAPRKLSAFLSVGALARGTMSGGAPKAEIENIAEADYAPDGKSLAIVRAVQDPAGCQLEYPVGTVLYKARLLTGLRFSPDGKYLGFIEHSLAGDDRGNAVILRATGEKVAAGPLRNSQRGLVWSPAGDEIWLTSPLEDGSIRSLDLKGATRDLMNVPGRLFLRDVAPDGRVLLDQGDTRHGMIAVTDDGATQRDVSWLNYSWLRAISDDGKTVLFEEEGNQAYRGYRVFVRNLDGSSAIELGTGYAIALSKDKAWVLAEQLNDSGPELWLYPVGAGQARRQAPPTWRPVNAGNFFADGKRAVVVGAEADRPLRIYVMDLASGALRPISEEGVLGGTLISPDQRWLTGRTSAQLLAADGGASQPIKGLRPGDTVHGWTSDGQLYVASGNPTALQVDRLDPFTGKRTSWRQLSAPAIVGVRPTPPVITPDGKAFAFGYGVGFSNLYVLTGVR